MPDPYDYNPFPDPNEWDADRKVRCALKWSAVCLVVAAVLLVAALLV